jgi:hypothetical protein
MIAAFGGRRAWVIRVLELSEILDGCLVYLSI